MFSGKEEYWFAHWCIKHNLSSAAFNKLFRNPTIATITNFTLSHTSCKRLMKCPTRLASTLWRGHSLLQSLGQSKQPSQWALHAFLSLQSCWIHWVPHGTTCVHGIYDMSSWNRIQWCWRMYRLRDTIKGQVVEWTARFVDFRHCYDDCDHFNSYDCRLELQCSPYLAVQTKHMLQIIRATWRNGQYIWVSENSTERLDQCARILHIW